MAQAEVHEVLSVDKDKLFSVITHYEDYPKFVEGCTSAKVDSRSGNKVRVTYQVNVMSQEVKYTLDHIEDLATGTIQWTLVESNFFKKNDGKWVLIPSGSGKSDVLYALDIEFKIPVPGFILKKLVKGSLPGMVKSFEKQAKVT